MALAARFPLQTVRPFGPLLTRRIPSLWQGMRGAGAGAEVFRAAFFDAAAGPTIVEGAGVAFGVAAGIGAAQRFDLRAGDARSVVGGLAVGARISSSAGDARAVAAASAGGASVAQAAGVAFGVTRADAPGGAVQSRSGDARAASVGALAAFGERRDLPWVVVSYRRGGRVIMRSRRG